MSILTVYYDNTSGRGRLVYMHEDTAVPADFNALKAATESYVTFPPGTDVDLEKWYFPAGVKTIRPDFDPNIEDSYSVELGDVVTIVSLPIGTIVTDEYSKTEFAATATVQSLTFTTAIEGKFNVEIVPPFPYKTRIVEVSTVGSD